MSAPKARTVKGPGKNALLKVRLRLRPKTDFKRESHRKKIDDSSWKKPRGVRNKIRKQFKGHVRLVRIGYGAPKDVRGMTYDGLVPVRVFNASFEKMAPDHVIIIASGVGAKKRQTILERADKLSVKVLNR